MNRALWRMLLWPQRHLLMAAALLALLAAILELVPFGILYALARYASQASADTRTITMLACGIAAAGLLRLLLFGQTNLLSHRAAFRMMRQLRQRLLQHLQKANPLQVQSRQGELRKTLLDDVASLENQISHTLPDLVSGICIPWLATAALAFVDPWMALCSLALLPPAFMASRQGLRDMDQILADWHNADAAASHGLIAYTRGIATLKAHHRIASSLQTLRQAIHALSVLATRVTRRTAVPYALFFALLSNNLLVVLPIGLWRYQAGLLDLPGLLLFAAIGTGQTLALLRVVGALGTLRRRQHALLRIQHVLDMPVMQDAPLTHAAPAHHPQAADAPDCRIRLAHVHARHTEQGSETLQNINLCLAPGSITAIAGPSGSGKSTLLALIAGFHHPCKGTVFIDGADLRTIPEPCITQRVALISQFPRLLHASLRANLLLANPLADAHTLQRALHISGLCDLVASLPQGMQTPLGEHGHRLSGGERQRVALARAILRNADIWLLDEATSGADTQTESHIVHALPAAMTGATVLIVTHRLPVLRMATRILWLEHGCLAAQGTHDELLRTHAAYRRWWQRHEQAANWRLPSRQTITQPHHAESPAPF